MAKEPEKRGGKREGKSKSKDILKKKKFVPKGPPKKQAPKSKGPSDEIRLNKYIANSGMCSRREADLYISTGQVQVNGQVVTEMGHKVKLTDEVKFDGRRISPEKKEYILLNKPKGFDTSTKEETLHKSAVGLVANASKYKLVPVGRLQRNTTGLLLFTNDHDMQKKLTDTGLMIRKIYQVSLDKNLKFEDFQKIEEGPTVEGKKVRIDAVSYVENAPKSEIGVQLSSNRNNIVRKIFEGLGYDVIKLDRVSYAGLTKKDLPRGHWRHLTKQEVINLGMM
ncbi:pseudouridine synthase [Planktosalinus lacus]|uniref:Pseudouridylate synthase n=1 Tax=Planktosalinus lacus TaxID=1526573 RepID=A0A8J2VA08_9FLAO|nr:pseudouridine synthase [Planktosalinus lacus]GGD90101.1 pseudouridylate synthase [Planktosalinus lacus]